MEPDLILLSPALTAQIVARRAPAILGIFGRIPGADFDIFQYGMLTRLSGASSRVPKRRQCGGFEVRMFLVSSSVANFKSKTTLEPYVC